MQSCIYSLQSEIVLASITDGLSAITEQVALLTYHAAAADPLLGTSLGPILAGMVAFRCGWRRWVNPGRAQEVLCMPAFARVPSSSVFHGTTETTRSESSFVSKSSYSFPFSRLLYIFPFDLPFITLSLLPESTNENLTPG